MLFYVSLLALFFLDNKPTIAVFPFTNASSSTSFQSSNQGKVGSLSHILAEKFSNKLNNSLSRKLTFVDRTKIESILFQNQKSSEKKDSKLDYSKLGRALKVDFLISGTIVDYSAKKQTVNAYGVNRKTIIHALSIDYQLIEINKGLLLYSNSASAIAHNSRGKCIEKVVSIASGQIYDWINSQEGIKIISEK